MFPASCGFAVEVCYSIDSLILCEKILEYYRK